MERCQNCGFTLPCECAERLVRELDTIPIEEAPKALRSYYGASDRQKDMVMCPECEARGSQAWDTTCEGRGYISRKDNTTKALIGAGADRPQQILTPESILKAVRTIWPDGILLDPCGAPGSLVRAQIEYQLPTHDGLAQPWFPCTYVNPPFKDWAKWLEYAQDQARRVREIVLLGPVRMQRKWFRKAWRAADQRIGLDPVKFVGYDSSLPESMCLLYWGDRDLAGACKEIGEEI